MPECNDSVFLARVRVHVDTLTTRHVLGTAPAKGRTVGGRGCEHKRWVDKRWIEAHVLDALRQIHGLLTVHSRSLQAVAQSLYLKDSQRLGPRQAVKNGVHSAIVCLSQELYALLVGREAVSSRRVRLLAAGLLRELSNGTLPIFFRQNFRGDFACYAGPDRPMSALAAYLPVLMQLSPPNLLQLNCQHGLSKWLAEEQAGLRGAVLPAMLAARSLGLLHADCTALVELWLARWLGGAELAAPRRPGQPMFGGYSSGVLRVGRRLGQGLQSLLAFTVANMTNDGNEVNDDQIGPQIQAKHHAAAQNNNQPVVCEPDGSPARELFTVLHRVHVGHSWYTDRQLFNVHAFSMVFSWISAQLEQREKTPLTLPKRAAGQDGRTQRVHCKGPPQATSGCPEYGTIHSTRTQNNMQGQGTRAGVSHSDATSANVAKLGGWPGAVELDTDLMVPASVDRRTMIPGGKIGKVHESHAKNGRTGKTTYCGTTSSSSLLDEFDGVTNVPDTAKRSWKGGGGNLEVGCSEELNAVLVRYCLRVLDQVAMRREAPQAAAPWPPPRIVATKGLSGGRVASGTTPSAAAASIFSAAAQLASASLLPQEQLSSQQGPGQQAVSHHADGASMKTVDVHSSGVPFSMKRDGQMSHAAGKSRRGLAKPTLSMATPAVTDSVSQNGPPPSKGTGAKSFSSAGMAEETAGAWKAASCCAPRPCEQLSPSWLAQPELQDDLFEAATLEVIRTLDLLCVARPKLVSRLFPTVKRFALDEFNTHIARSASRHRAVVFLAVLQFFLNHNEHVIFDVQPVFHWFFTEYLRRHYAQPLVATTTISFCLRNTAALLSRTSVFELYFPALLKLVATHPTASTVLRFMEMLPACVSPSSFGKLLHSLLDLPLMAGILEQQPEPVSPAPEAASSVKSQLRTHCAHVRAAVAGTPRASALARKTATEDVGNLDRGHNAPAPCPAYQNSAAPSTSFASGKACKNRGTYTMGRTSATINSRHNDYPIVAPSLGESTTVGLEARLIALLLRDQAMQNGRHMGIASSRPAVSACGSNKDTNSTCGSPWGACAWWSRGACHAASSISQRLVLTPRLQAACTAVLKLLGVYFHVMLRDAPASMLLHTVRIVFARFELLFGPPKFRRQVRRVLLDHCLAAFHQRPCFLISLKCDMVDIISGRGPAQGLTAWNKSKNASSLPGARLFAAEEHHKTSFGMLKRGGTGEQELVLHLCWVVGQYCNMSVLQKSAQQLQQRQDAGANDQGRPGHQWGESTQTMRQHLHDLHHAVELLAYERISAMRWLEMQCGPDHMATSHGTNADKNALSTDLDDRGWVAASGTASAKDDMAGPSIHGGPPNILVLSGASTSTAAKVTHRHNAFVPTPRQGSMESAGRMSSEDAHPRPYHAATLKANRGDVHAARLLAVVVSVLTKLAVQLMELAPRVLLCLAKMLAHRQCLHPAVVQRASEAVQLLRRPSLATAIFNRHGQGLSRSLLDSHSSLQFLMQRTTGFLPTKPIHSFELNEAVGSQACADARIAFQRFFGDGEVDTKLQHGGNVESTRSDK